MLKGDKMKGDPETTVEELKELVRKFIHEREWEKFHNPKDLAEAICIEAAELLELFQWITSEEASAWRDVPSKVRRIREELADIFIYCLSMANTTKIDVTDVVTSKLKRNEIKYPIEKYRGKAHLS